MIKHCNNNTSKKEASLPTAIFFQLAVGTASILKAKQNKAGRKLQPQIKIQYHQPTTANRETTLEKQKPIHQPWKAKIQQQPPTGRHRQNSSRQTDSPKRHKNNSKRPTYSLNEQTFKHETKKQDFGGRR